MKVIKCTNDAIDLQLSKRELVMLNNSLNEVCNGIDIFEFDTRIGASLEEVNKLLQALGRLLDQLECGGQ